LARAWRPFKLEPVRDGGKIRRAISLEGPGVDGLPALLLHTSKRDPIRRRRRRHSQFLFKLDPGASQQVFIVTGFALRICPGSLVLVPKIRTARMSQQDL